MSLTHRLFSSVRIFHPSFAMKAQFRAVDFCNQGPQTALGRQIVFHAIRGLAFSSLFCFQKKFLCIWSIKIVTLWEEGRRTNVGGEKFEITLNKREPTYFREEISLPMIYTRFGFENNFFEVQICRMVRTKENPRYRPKWDFANILNWLAREVRRWVLICFEKIIADLWNWPLGQRLCRTHQ